LPACTSSPATPHKAMWNPREPSSMPTPDPPICTPCSYSCSIFDVYRTVDLLLEQLALIPYLHAHRGAAESVMPARPRTTLEVVNTVNRGAGMEHSALARRQVARSGRYGQRARGRANASRSVCGRGSEGRSAYQMAQGPRPEQSVLVATQNGR
jgi:hypothetical protein